MLDRVLFVHVNLLAPLESPDTIPISEATILAHLKKHGFSGTILGDYGNAPLSPQVLAQAIQKESPLAIGFTTYQENIQQIRLWARFAKKIAPETPIILGGPQVTFMPGEALRHMPEIDYLCRGEGEEVMLQLAGALQRGDDVAKVTGIGFLRDGRKVETPPTAPTTPLDRYPSPYLTEGIDLRGKERVILLTSRGCPYTCAFCYTPKASGRKVRFFSQDRIIDEMRYLKSKGISSFWFADTNLSYSKKRLVSLLEAMIEHVPGISFWCQTRYDLMNEELLQLLRRAGAENVAYGLESANPSVLDTIQKPIDLQRLSEVIRLTQKAGMEVELFSMFGLPGETMDQALRTLQFVQENGVAIQGNSISQQAHLFFGTPLNDTPEQFGIHPLPYTRPAYLSACRDYETDAMSTQDMHKVGLVWRLNRQDFEEDVAAGHNLFHRASFITQNRDALADRPEAFVHLAQIYLALEEYAAAVDTMESLSHRFSDDASVKRFLQKPIRCFQGTPRSLSRGYKVVYDCQGTANGTVLPATVGRYQTAVLGEGTVLVDFERNLLGKKAGQDLAFSVVFPDDYPQRELAGRSIAFQVHLWQVFKPVTFDHYQAFRAADLDNLVQDYPPYDTQVLRQVNIHLYYSAVQGALQKGIIPPLPDAYMLINLFLKLGLIEKADQVTEKLPRNPIVRGQLAHVYRVNGLAERALAFLDPSQGSAVTIDEERIQWIKAQALFDLGQYEASEAIVSAMGYRNNVELQELRVKLAQQLALPVTTYLEREEALLDMKTSLLSR